MIKNLNIWDITKSILSIAIIIFLFININSIKKFFTEFNKNDTQSLTETQVIRIASDVMQAQVVANKEQFKLLLDELSKSESRALQSAKELIKEQGGKITELGQVVGRLNASINEINTSQIQYIKAPDPEKEVLIIPADRPASNGELIPEGNMYYNPGQKDIDKKFVYTPLPLDFYVDVVHTQDGTGNYKEGGVNVSMAISSPSIPGLEDKKFPVNIKEFKYAKIPISEKSFKLNPTMALGGTITNDLLVPELNFSFWSYGKTDIDMDWRFVTFGFGGEEDRFSASFTPFSYNVGKILPVINNLFLGPTIGIDSESNVSYGGSLSVPF